MVLGNHGGGTSNPLMIQVAELITPPVLEQDHLGVSRWGARVTRPPQPHACCATDLVCTSEEANTRQTEEHVQIAIITGIKDILYFVYIRYYISIYRTCISKASIKTCKCTVSSAEQTHSSHHVYRPYPQNKACNKSTKK